MADWGNSRIQVRNIFVKKTTVIYILQVFDQYGSFLSYVNTSGCPLYGPQVCRNIQYTIFAFIDFQKYFQGIALTADGNIVVADSGNHCIKIYKYLQ